MSDICLTNSKRNTTLHISKNCWFVRNITQYKFDLINIL